jgi:magnesium-transporting ATPase (P-type)
MITGDHPQTALAIARDLGIADTTDHVVTGAELSAARHDPAAFDTLARDARIFARVEPVQKLSIVQALQRAGHVVAVTGDGVNDAPALSIADLGVAMGRGGTDAARSAADLILADDNLATIVPGIEEGRIAYDNVRKLIYLLITTGLGEIVLFLLSIIAQLPVPLFAVQLLWLNLVTNGIQDIALAFEKGEPGVLARQPRPPRERLFERRMITQVLVAGGYMGAAAFAFYAWMLDRGVSEPVARNLLLLLMVWFENVHALNARSETRSVFRIPFAANPFLIVAIVAAQGLHIAAIYLPGLSDVLDLQPIALTDWLMVAAIAASLLIVGEILKLATVARNRRSNT